MRIGGQTWTASTLERIRATVAASPELTRSALSRQVCDWMDWRDATGRVCEVSARVALKRLEERKVVELPPARACPPAPRGATGAWLETPSVSCSFAELGPVEWVLLESGDRELSRVWRELMERHHPLGGGPLCGAQLRYLLRSESAGWLGGLAFSAPAYRLSARDQWIGWSESQRAQGLHRLVANSRFLVLPQVKVPHLASHILGRTLRRLADDWTARYGVRPVLVESFVDSARYAGTAYRASNWHYVGTTTGRGRNDRTHTANGSAKAVFLYPLCEDWRTQIGGVAPEFVPEPARDWADDEFGKVNLADHRLNRRVVALARDRFAQPQASLPQACGTRAKTKAAYRLLQHEKCTMDTLLQSHYESTRHRVAKQPVVLAVQDSSSLNYSTHTATTGLGPLNTSKDESVGLWMHDTLVLTPAGVPLGLIDVQLWARDPEQMGKRATRRERPIEEKESAKWLVSHQAASQLQAQCPNTQVISVGDREADIYELFVAAQAPDSPAQLLVRAEKTRRMTQEHGSLWAFMAEQPVRFEHVLSVPRQGTRKARDANMELRFAQVDLRPPKTRKTLPLLSAWAVWTREIDPPEGVPPLEWMILTTVPTQSEDEALERLDWYATRWQIEVYHRTLKSGCRIEDRQLGSAKGLEACLAIDLVVAWRIFHLAKLGRETPDVPCTVYFEDAQWKALWVRVNRSTPPQQPPTLNQAMRMVASLGGFLGRKGDGEPGTQTLWRGIQRLDDITEMYLFFTATTGPPGVQPTYG